jgi:hypothetical protein
MRQQQIWWSSSEWLHRFNSTQENSEETTVDLYSTIFALIGLSLLGSLFALLACVSASLAGSHWGSRGVNIAVSATGLLLILPLSALCIAAYDHSYVLGLFAACAFALSYVALGWKAAQFTRRQIAFKLAVCDKLVADDGALLHKLDFDRDDVVSRDDLNEIAQRVLGSGLSRRELSVIRCHFHQIGHSIDRENGFYIITRSDLTTLIARMRERHRAWV